MTPPTVSVITATYRRPNLLLDRCIPSVQAQTWPAVEHIIVHDGPAPGLAQQIIARIAHEPPVPLLKSGPGEMFTARPAGPRIPVTYDELPDWVPVANSGVRPRLRGLELAKGDFIAYLDDDDAYRPEHCELLATALIQNPGSGFAYSQMASHGAQMGPATGNIIGNAELGACQVGTPMIMHRRELTELATWGPPDSMEDWRLVARWLQRLVRAEFVPQVTVDAYPSTYRNTLDEPAR
jgi:glycosyltransferase involved in cell wall biosynthesis